LAFGSGIAFGVAFLMRPELAWGFLAVVAAWQIVGPDTVAGNRARLVGVALAGFAIALAPLEIYTLKHYGRVVPAHLSANAGLLQASWVAERTHLLSTWLLPSGWTRSGPAHPETFWIAAPLILLACVPARPDVVRGGRRFLWIVTALVIAAVVLTAPNDGGGQWAPRYLLFAYVPLVVLAADAVETLPRRSATVAAITVLLLACLWIQRSAYRDLRSTKSTYGRVVDFVTTQVESDGYVVSDLWWLDQVAASAMSDRRLVYVPDDASGHAVMQRLSRAVVPIVIVIRSETQSPDVTPWREDTCYVEIKRETLEVRRLLAITLHHRCSQ
jgi:hypothetical protein